MVVNSFCGEFLLQSHAALHGEFLLISLTHPVLVYVGSTTCVPCVGLYGEFLLHAQCWFTCGVSLTDPMLASFLGSFSHKVYAGYFM